MREQNEGKEARIDAVYPVCGLKTTKHQVQQVLYFEVRANFAMNLSDVLSLVERVNLEFLGLATSTPHTEEKAI